MIVSEIRDIFKKVSPTEVVGSILDIGDYYIVLLTKSSVKRGDFVLDNQYKLNKKTRKIAPFNPSMEQDSRVKRAYLEALKRKPLYMKTGLIDG